MTRVAVVDNGVHEGITLEQCVAIADDGTVLPRPGEAGLTHGTACARIIREACDSACLASVRVLDEHMMGSPPQLIRGISWAVDHGYQIVNVSAGTLNRAWYPALRQLANRAASCGSVIVAACHNAGICSLPAALGNAIGVRVGTLSGVTGDLCLLHGDLC